MFHAWPPRRGGTSECYSLVMMSYMCLSIHPSAASHVVVVVLHSMVFVSSDVGIKLGSDASYLTRLLCN